MKHWKLKNAGLKVIDDSFSASLLLLLLNKNMEEKQ
jgi:hypothetical protein